MLHFTNFLKLKQLDVSYLEVGYAQEHHEMEIAVAKPGPFSARI